MLFTVYIHFYLSNINSINCTGKYFVIKNRIVKLQKTKIFKVLCSLLNLFKLIFRFKFFINLSDVRVMIDL